MCWYKLPHRSLAVHDAQAWCRRNPCARDLPAILTTIRSRLEQALTGWRHLSLAARPRVLWVAAHYLELPAMLEETWACLLGCVEDTLMRVWRLEGDAHARLLAASARDGVLFKRVVMPQLVRAHILWGAAGALRCWLWSGPGEACLRWQPAVQCTQRPFQRPNTSTCSFSSVTAYTCLLLYTRIEPGRHRRQERPGPL